MKEVLEHDDLLEKLGVNQAYFMDRGLVKYEDAPEKQLRVVQVDDLKEGGQREHELISEAAEAWHQMKLAAQNDGVELVMVSAYRSVARQAEIVGKKYERGLGAEDIFAVSAPPGFSEHHTGRAVDISTPGYAVLEEEFEESEAFRWLTERAGEFGFTMTYPRENAYGFLYEPWHWVWNDKSNESLT